MPDLGPIRGILWFLAVSKRYWLLPMVIMLLILGMMFMFRRSSIVAPFLYTLF